jgi:hypothetical protein
MPTDIQSGNDIDIGEIYEDVFYHPCICIGCDEFQVWGISLVDGSYPRSVDVKVSAIRKLTPEEAWHWRTKGPIDPDTEVADKWW